MCFFDMGVVRPNITSESFRRPAAKRLDLLLMRQFGRNGWKRPGGFGMVGGVMAC